MAGTAHPHAGHEHHLCYLRNLGFHKTNLNEYKELVVDGKYICKECGRVAADRKNLCKPVRL